MLQYHPIPTQIAHAYQAGGRDAYGNLPERMTSQGTGNPCRHCLSYIPDGADMLVLSYRPFPTEQPYAETGPIFLCATPCVAPSDKQTRPEVMENDGDFLVRGYDARDRIVYGTGAVVPCGLAETKAAEILQNADVAYVHIRSATNNCYRLRIDRV